MADPAVTIHVSLLAFQLLALASPPFPGRRFFVVSVLIALAVASHFAKFDTDVPSDAQPFALLWPIYLGTLNEFLCASGDGPEDSYWRIDRPAREARSMIPWGFRKLKWAAALMFNTRGVRWNYEVDKVPPKPKVTRGRFLFGQVLQFCKILLVSDLLFQLTERFFWTPRPESSKYLTVDHPDWSWSFIRVLTWACGPYFFVSLQYVVATIIAVGLGFSQPEDWPAYFGNVTQATSVRNFWGSFWHQTLRRSLTKFNDFIITTFAIPRGTNLSSYTQIWVAFAVSGFMHAQSMLLLPHSPNLTTSERSTGVLLFFLWQAVAITAEDFAIWLWRQASGGKAMSPRVSRLIGYAWVTWSMWFSVPWAADVMMRIRITEESMLPFSLVRSVVQRIPLPP